MTNDDKDLNPAINTDQTIYRQPTTDYGPEDGNDKGMEPSVFLTKEGAVGFNHYGKCVVKPIKEWVEMAWNTPQQSSDPMKELDFKPNGYDMDGNPIQHSLSGGPQQPSENQTYIDHNTGETICASCGTHFPKQHPSEPLKELDEKAILMVLDQCCPVSMDKMAKEMIAQILWNKFGQPSEKKALSLNNIYEIIKRCDKNFNPEEDDEGDRHYIATLSEEFCDFMAKAIHSALPAQREVR